MTIAGALKVAGVTVDEDTLAMTDLTATAVEINQALDGIGADVTAAHLTELSDGSATVLHTHGPAAANGLSGLGVARFTFDPSATAGMRTIAAHGLGVTIPDNAIILGGGMEILTTFTSATDAGTVALSVEGANDLVTATAISSGTFWDAVTYKGVVPTALELGGVATAIKLTAARQITATVAVEALTAGKLVGWLFYVVGA